MSGNARKLIPTGHIRLTDAFEMLRNSKCALDAESDVNALCDAFGPHGNLQALVSPPNILECLVLDGDFWFDPMSDLMFRHETVPFDEFGSKAKGQASFVGLNAFEHWLEDLSRTRHELIAKYNPMAIEYWNIPMVLVWMAEREPNAVLPYSDSFRQHILKPSTSIFDFASRIIGFACSAYESEAAKLYGIGDYKEILRSVADGRLSARGTKSDGTEVELPRNHVKNLQLNFEELKKYKTFKDVWRVLGREPLEVLESYTDLYLARDGVLSCWPKRREFPKTTSSQFHYRIGKKFTPFFDAAVFLAANGATTQTDEIADQNLFEKGVAMLVEAICDEKVSARGKNEVEQKSSTIEADYWVDAKYLYDNSSGNDDGATMDITDPQNLIVGFWKMGTPPKDKREPCWASIEVNTTQLLALIDGPSEAELKVQMEEELAHEIFSEFVDKSPEAKTHHKREIFEILVTQNPHLHNYFNLQSGIRGRAFLRAWRKATVAHPIWCAAG